MLDDKPGKILVIDDDTYILDMIKNILDREGYQTQGVQSGKKALEVVKSSQPDLILLDINLPDMDGFKICKKIKSVKKSREIPVIFITGDSSRNSIQKSFEAGGSDYVSKPFVIEEVLARIKMAINNARAKKVLERVNKELEERVALQTRRLNLLFSITKLATESLSLEEILHKVVGFLDDSMSHFNVVSAIYYRENEITDQDYSDHREVMNCDLKIDQKKVGKILLLSPSEFDIGRTEARDESQALLEAVSNEVSKIIKQKEAEEKVKTQWKYYRALKNNSPEGIVTLDQNRNVVDINNAFQKIFGYDLETLHGKNLDEFILPSRLKEEGSQIGEKITEGENIFTNSVRKTRDGKEIQCSLIGAPINIDSQHMDYFLIYRDTTREKELEVQLMQANKMEAIGQLAAGIAHEINTPTQYVNSNIEFFTDAFPDLFMLLEEYNKFDSYIQKNFAEEDIRTWKKLSEKIDIEFLESEIKSALDDSLDGLRKISKIVDAMRTFSHPGTQQKEEINVNKIIQKTITVSRNEWKYDVELETDLENNIPAIPVYQDQISQVMLNLIVNATHAIQEAHENKQNGKGRIKISSCSNQRNLKIEVSDNGSGIPKNIRDKVFNPFFTTKEVGQGTGPGLSMAYNVVVENHGGNIYFDTEVEKGTTFVVELPRQRN